MELLNFFGHGQSNGFAHRWKKHGLGYAPAIHGYVAPGWEKVKEEAEENFRSRCERGFSCCVFHKGIKVVDIWGGECEAGKEWEEDTIGNVFSVSKGLSAMILLILQSRGFLDWDAPVAKYWPEFATNGKEATTVRQLMSHVAGAAAMDKQLSQTDLLDWRVVGEALAATTPEWPVGEKIGYMGITIGWHIDQLVRRLDPKARSCQQFIQEEVIPALGLEGQFYFGVPANVVDRTRRIAVINAWAPIDLIKYGMAQKRFPPEFVKNFLFDTKSYAFRALGNPACLGNAAFYNTETCRAMEIPAANGTTNARFVATYYDAFTKAATGKGNPLGFSKAAIEEMQKDVPVPARGAFDECLRTDTSYSHGFFRPFPHCEFGTEKAFGTPGAGGSFGFADPNAEISYAWTTNSMGIFLYQDPRELHIRKAVYDIVGKLGGRTRKQMPDKFLGDLIEMPNVIYHRQSWFELISRYLPCS